MQGCAGHGGYSADSETVIGQSPDCLKDRCPCRDHVIDNNEAVTAVSEPTAGNSGKGADDCRLTLVRGATNVTALIGLAAQAQVDGRRLAGGAQDAGCLPRDHGHRVSTASAKG